jgi:hypothetical protein
MAAAGDCIRGLRQDGWLRPQAFAERLESSLRAPLVRDRPEGDRVQPRPRGLAVGRFQESSPGDQERLRDDVFGISWDRPFDASRMRARIGTG